MKFKLNIESSNAAVVGDGAEIVVADMIEKVAAQIREGYTSGYPRDPYSSGGPIGYWEYEPEAEASEPTETTCRHCGERILQEENGAGRLIWVHDYGSTVCDDNPPGTIEDGDTNTTAEPEED